MSDLIQAATTSNAWPFVEARRILDHVGNKVPKKGYILFETGYGPSGLPHIGTFAEVVRTTMIMNALKSISDIPTKLICFSDDMDGIRKVPDNIPNKEMVAKHLHKPLTAVPDPFGEFPSYGDYMNNKLKSFLDSFGFEYEFMSATKCYKSGKFNNGMFKCLENYQQIMDIMLPTLGPERQATYSPFMPLCPYTGAVLQVKIEEVKPETKTIIYLNQDGKLVETEITDGKCKLQWKPDFAMRWAELEVDFEMYGKDHRPNAETYSNLCRAFKGRPPVQYFYELFLDEEGKKISKSKGNSISVEEWLHYAPSESLALFMYQNPQRAKKLFFEIIPKCVDEYISLSETYGEEELEKKLQNPIHHIHNGDVKKLETRGISFALLLNLVSACNTEDKNILWGYIQKYSPGATPENSPYLDHMTKYALNYYNDFIKNSKDFMQPNGEQKALLKEMIKFLESIDPKTEGEEIQKGIYKIGRESNYENLRDYFVDLYRILLGQNSGPRLGSFIALFGSINMIKLINDRLAGRTA